MVFVMITSKQVIKKKISIELKILKLNDELTDLQDKCPHHTLRYRGCGTSGGWDYEGSYWYDWFCPDCDKRWRTEQKYDIEMDILKKYPNAKKIDKYDNRKEYDNFYRSGSSTG